MPHLFLHKPSAGLPVVMSVLAILPVLGHATLFGSGHETDEGAAAHIFQLLMMLQLPLIGVFCWKWLRRTQRQSLAIIALQLLCWLAAALSAYMLT